MAFLPTDIRIIFTNYDIITYFLNLASCSEHLISVLLVEETGAPGENHRPAVSHWNFIT
jgi:hypothetical protein